MLIGGAALISAAVWSLSRETSLVTKGLAVITNLWILASILAGGYGILRDDFKPGTNNPFDLQAKFGIVAIIFFAVLVILS